MPGEGGGGFIPVPSGGGGGSPLTDWGAFADWISGKGKPRVDERIIAAAEFNNQIAAGGEADLELAELASQATRENVGPGWFGWSESIPAAASAAREYLFTHAPPQYGGPFPVHPFAAGGRSSVLLPQPTPTQTQQRGGFWSALVQLLLGLFGPRRRGPGGTQVMISIPPWATDQSPGSWGGGTGGAAMPGEGDYWGWGPGLDWGDVISGVQWLFGDQRTSSPAPYTLPGGASTGQACGNGNGLQALMSPYGTGTGVRAKTFVVPHPVTCKPVWFKPAGRPILWSSDLSAVRKVRRLRRRLGGR